MDFVFKLTHMEKGWIRMVSFGDLISMEYKGKVMGKYTFAGILRIESEMISDQWNDDTKKTYARDYNIRILPHFRPLKPMQDYSEDDINEILEKINKEKKYSETTLKHFRYLIWIVYKAGAENGLYVDQLLWGNLSEHGEDGKKTKTKNQLIKKSFSIEEEKQLLGWFKNLHPHNVTGPEIGVALMLFFGLRNQEACGLNYGAIKIITQYRIPCLYIFQTTSVQSNVLKLGGKTSNAIRIIPMFDFLYDFIRERMEFLENQISCGKIQGVKSVEELPVVFTKSRYDIRGQSRDLTRFGKWLLDSLNMGELIKETRRVIMRNAMEGVDIGEKDPTTYIFRRNFATHLSILGLSPEEIQYIIGHNIEKIGEERSHFASDEKLYDIKQKLEEHPYRLFLSNLGDGKKTVGIEGYKNNLSTEEILRIEPMIKSNQIQVQIDALEPNDDIFFGTTKEISITSVALGSSQVDNSSVGNANIRRQVREYYRKKMKSP